MISQCISKENKKYNIIILASGYGSRMGEASNYIPKALSKLGSKRAIDYIIERYTLVANEYVITLGWQGDLLESYIKGNYPKLKVKFSYEKPEDLKNNAISTMYALDNVDSRYGTIVVFCDLFIMENIFIEDDSILVATPETKGQIGFFRHSVDYKNLNNLLIKKEDLAIKPTTEEYGIMGCFIFSDTYLLKECTYFNHENLTDLTDDIIFRYSELANMKAIKCNKAIEFGNEDDLKKAQELWSRGIW